MIDRDDVRIGNRKQRQLEGNLVMNVRKNRRLHLESLEARQMMTGDISAVMSGATLNITEKSGHAGEANYVAISRLPNGFIRIDGRDTAHASSNPVNGFAFQDFPTPVGGLNITANLGGGSDTVRILPGARLNDVVLNLGGPGIDVDTVDINGLTTTGKLSISTGAGVDNIFLQNSNIGDGNGVDDVVIDAGAGIDYVQVGNTTNYQTIKGSLFLNTSTTANEAEIDRVVVQLTTVRDFLTVSTGGGDDTVTMLADYAGKDISLITGDGADTATLRDCTAADHFYLLMGNGDDVLNMQNLRAANLYADGGAGVNTLNHYYDGPTEVTSYLNFDTINGRKIVFKPLNGNGTVQHS